MEKIEQQSVAVAGGVPVELRDWMERFAEAVRRRDYAAGRALVDEGVVGFGSRAERAAGLDDLERRQWRRVWSATEGFDFDYEYACGGASGDVSWVAAPWSSDGFGPDGRPFRRSGRATLVLARRGGQWLAVHTHFSMTPREADGGAAPEGSHRRVP